MGKGRAAQGSDKRCICGIGEGRADFPIPEDGLAMARLADETERGGNPRDWSPPHRKLAPAKLASLGQMGQLAREKENLPCVFFQFMERWPGQLGGCRP